MSTPISADVVRRHALPEVMLPADLAIALGVPLDVAASEAHAGSFGPCFLVGGAPAVLRTEFLKALSNRAAALTEDRREVLRAPWLARPEGRP